MKGTCRLCEQNRFLRESHIIPKFFFQWLRRSSGSGHIRSGQKINKRTQDGLKLFWLCHECETLFSKWEQYFSNNVFYPQLKTSSVFNYDENLLRFCVSVSWRVLKYFIEINEIDHLSDISQNEMYECLNTWRDYLLNIRDNIGVFEQHLYNFTNEIQGDLSTKTCFVHRYLQRTVEFNPINDHKRCALIYIVLPNFMLLGYICTPIPLYTQSRIEKKGIIKPCCYDFSENFMNYIKDRAEKRNMLKEKLSDQQLKKIKDSYSNATKNIAKTETFKSLQRDVRLFGLKKVFEKNDGSV